MIKSKVCRLIATRFLWMTNLMSGLAVVMSCRSSASSDTLGHIYSFIIFPEVAILKKVLKNANQRLFEGNEIFCAH
jgi:hypothetical protein